MTYFDTAYVYDGGGSERAAKEALISRHPRESFTLATKLNVHANGCTGEESAKRQLETSLERTGAGEIPPEGRGFVHGPFEDGTFRDAQIGAEGLSRVACDRP